MIHKRLNLYQIEKFFRSIIILKKKVFSMFSLEKLQKNFSKKKFEKYLKNRESLK